MWAGAGHGRIDRHPSYIGRGYADFNNVGILITKVSHGAEAGILSRSCCGRPVRIGHWCKGVWMKCKPSGERNLDSSSPESHGPRSSAMHRALYPPGYKASEDQRISRAHHESRGEDCERGGGHGAAPIRVIHQVAGAGVVDDPGIERDAPGRRRRHRGVRKPPLTAPGKIA